MLFVVLLCHARCIIKKGKTTKLYRRPVEVDIELRISKRQIKNKQGSQGRFRVEREKEQGGGERRGEGERRGMEGTDADRGRASSLTSVESIDRTLDCTSASQVTTPPPPPNHK